MAQSETSNTVAVGVGLAAILVAVAVAALSNSREMNNMIASLNLAIFGLALVIVSKR